MCGCVSQLKRGGVLHAHNGLLQFYACRHLSGNDHQRQKEILVRVIFRALDVTY